MNNETGRFYSSEHLYQQLALLSKSPIDSINAEKILLLESKTEQKPVALSAQFAYQVNSVMRYLPDEQSFPDLVYWEMPDRGNATLYSQEYKNLLKDGIASGSRAPQEWIELDHDFSATQKREMKIMRRKMVRKVPDLKTLREKSETGNLMEISGIGLRRWAFWYLASRKIGESIQIYSS